MHEALCLLGKARIENWSGREPESRVGRPPPDPPWVWNRRVSGDIDFLKISDSGEIVGVSEQEANDWWEAVKPELIAEWKEEEKASRRWRDCLALMRNELASGRFSAEVLSGDGHFERISKKQWLSNQGGTFMASGIADFRVSNGFNTFSIEGHIVFAIDFLKTNIDQPHVNESSPNKPNEPKDVPKSTDIGNDFSNFPYLAFMVRASIEGPFTRDNRVPKKIIEDWLLKNWPPELGAPTTTKLTTMATFLRRPEDEKGGNLT